MVIYDKTKATGGHNVDLNPTIYKTGKSKIIIQGEINKDGSLQFYLTPNSKTVDNNKSMNISLANKLDSDYYLPQNNADIEGISWGDIGETELELFDNNGMVSQYDTTNNEYTLQKGIEFRADTSNIPHSVPSEFSDADIATLVQQKGLTKDASKVKITSVADDANKELSVAISIVGDGGITYNASHTFNVSKYVPPSKSNINLWIIIGATAGAVVLLAIIIGTSAWLYKKKRTPTSHSGRSGHSGRSRSDTQQYQNRNRKPNPNSSKYGSNTKRKRR